jgi:hypothetical protein
MLSLGIFGIAGLAGCAHSCYSGFFLNGGGNGNGGLITTPVNLSSSCPLTQNSGVVNVVAAHVSLCEMCAAPHNGSIFVTIRGIQLHSAASSDANGAEWLEVAPQLATEPRQIRLSPDSTPVLLVQRASVPAGTYRELRLEFRTEDSSPGVSSANPENACGVSAWNCYVPSDGRVEPLAWATAQPEILVPVQGSATDSLLIVPGSGVELEIRLAPHRVIYTSGSEPLQTQILLSGTVNFVRLPAAQDLPLP